MASPAQQSDTTQVVVKIGDGEEQEYLLPTETVRALESIAARGKMSFIDALQQAILNEDFIEGEQKNGAKLLIKKGNELREIVRESRASVA
jgi:hypothetical protein